jgi:hypothetical protein
MSSKCNRTSILGISVGINAVISQVDIANTLATHVTSVFSTDNYDPAFKLLKDNAEALPLNFFS